MGQNERIFNIICQQLNEEPAERISKVRVRKLVFDAIEQCQLPCEPSYCIEFFASEPEFHYRYKDMTEALLDHIESNRGVKAVLDHSGSNIMNQLIDFGLVLERQVELTFQ